LSEAKAITRLVLEKFIPSAIKPEMEVAEQTEQQLQQALQELLQHRPVQYVLNEAWFYHLPFQVNEQVLIPRQETEELVEWILQTESSNNPNPNVLDIGTGSGCIPITIKKNRPAAQVTAIDVCSSALDVAIQNSITHETEIEFILLDFLDEGKWKQLPAFDLIISNPPYIKASEQATMAAHVLNYEPHQALFVPDTDALIFYKKIAAFGKTHLKPKGVIYLEINQQAGEETVTVFTAAGYSTVELKKDMSGNDRMVRASW
jgi:release factor glutamine methyltransferase